MVEREKCGSKLLKGVALVQHLPGGGFEEKLETRVTPILRSDSRPRDLPTGKQELIIFVTNVKV
jgi:hypothetical protein